jgi:hypothetical protein
LGPPNAGKSQLLAALTSAHPEIAPYPYTTQKILPGMMPFENIQIQLVDTPAISKEYFESELSSLIRNADCILLLCDLSASNCVQQITGVIQQLERVHIRLGGDSQGLSEEGYAYKKTVLVGNKRDLPEAESNFAQVKEVYETKFPLITISALHGQNLEQLKQKIYEELEIIRVYTKEPSQEADLADPVILKKESRLLEAALQIHKDFAQKLKYARVWGKGRYAGQMIGKTDQLLEGDIVEFHA